MPISYKKTVAVLEGRCAIEEAETLLSWLLEHPRGKLNLKRLEHPHTAVLQVMMALRPEVSAVPEQEEVATWLQAVMNGRE